jgi:hypothetical protein
LSLLFLELNGYCVNAVRLHVYAADVLVRLGVDRDDFRYPPFCARAWLADGALDCIREGSFCVRPIAVGAQPVRVWRRDGLAVQSPGSAPDGTASPAGLGNADAFAPLVPGVVRAAVSLMVIARPVSLVVGAAGMMSWPARSRVCRSAAVSIRSARPSADARARCDGGEDGQAKRASGPPGGGQGGVEQAPGPPAGRRWCRRRSQR